MTILHEASSEGGLGFCHAQLPILPEDHHGPLIIALDSNILIDLRVHGRSLMNDDEALDVGEEYEKELLALGDLLNIWLMRDVRFIVTSRSFTDARKPTLHFLKSRPADISAIDQALTHQLGDWDFIPPSANSNSISVGKELGLPDSADRDLVLEAQTVGAHCFLTRDKRVLTQTKLTGRRIFISSPSKLSSIFNESGIDLFKGGICGSRDCPYAHSHLLLPDISKWSPVLGLFE